MTLAAAPAPPRRRDAVVALALAAVVGGLAACTGGLPPPGGEWISKHERGHPLTGRIWQPATRRFADPAALLTAARGADFVLIGEKHDNPDHHRLQAWLTVGLIAAGRRVAVAFEMFAADQAPAIAAHLRDHPKDGDGLGAAVAWAKSGWPDWRHYRPIAQAALDAGLPVAAANLAAETVRAMGRQGEDGLPPEIRERLGRLGPDGAGVKAAMVAEMRESHCNMLPESMTEKMIVIQRARDAYMAWRMVEAASAPRIDGAVLIAGAGHARADRGVPEFLARMAPGRKVLSIGLIETDGERRAPEDYAGARRATALPFDFVWFTPRYDDEDPCAAHAGALKRLQHRK